jgi:hypothetical protein
MAIFPWYTGMTKPWSFPTFVDDSGNNINIAGATITMRYTVNSGASQAGTGTVAIAAPAFTYSPSAADVAAANAGTYSFQFTATLADGSVVKSDIPTGSMILSL